ncbi:MAG: beta-ketoacyl-[acyl-carrier-protein] synthase family protein [Planctomycetota bacterium]
MDAAADIVISGIGVVSPIGIGCDEFWTALEQGTSGIRPIDLFDASALSVRFGGQITDFDPRRFVRPRKSLKVMSREMQLGFAAAELAMADAGLVSTDLEPERFGIVFGADMIYAGLEDLEATYRCAGVSGQFEFARWAEAIHEEVHPLWLLKHLPNMAASHVAIAQDARGPNNTIVLGDVSSLLAVAEAASVIERGWADVMIAGGTGCRLHPTAMVARGAAQLSHRGDDFATASRPFDRDRDGLVNGEGAGAVILESRQHAARRGASVIGRVMATAARCEPRARRDGIAGTSLRQAIRAARESAGLEARDVGHLNAHGLSTIEMDRAEAQAIAAELGDVPVTAPKSAFGHLGAGGGVVEMIASVLGLAAGVVPPTRNYEIPDPECPVNVVRGGPLAGRPATAIAVNACTTGQAVAVALASE